jgi:hypothetical protein
LCPALAPASRLPFPADTMNIPQASLNASGILRLLLG